MKARLLVALLLGGLTVALTAPEAYGHGGMQEGEKGLAGPIGASLLVALAGYLFMVWDIPSLMRFKGND
jgi:predicted acyltransferase